VPWGKLALGGVPATEPREASLILERVKQLATEAGLGAVRSGDAGTIVDPQVQRFMELLEQYFSLGGDASAALDALQALRQDLRAHLAKKRESGSVPSANRPRCARG
jgi:hypothetical protein